MSYDSYVCSMRASSVHTYIGHSLVLATTFCSTINFRKQLGGKLGDSLQIDLGINTVGDLLQFSEQKLQERYGFNTGLVGRT